MQACALNFLLIFSGYNSSTQVMVMFLTEMTSTIIYTVRRFDDETILETGNSS
jgi:hypothetical protein